MRDKRASSPPPPTSVASILVATLDAASNHTATNSASFLPPSESSVLTSSPLSIAASSALARSKHATTDGSSEGMSAEEGEKAKLLAARTVHIKTKITCTIGPKTQSVEMLTKLIAAGMNVLRMNFSHGTHEFHQKTIDNLHTALANLNAHGSPDETAGLRRGKAGSDTQTGKCVAVMLDTKGPEIRTGKVKGGSAKLVSGQPFRFYCQPPRPISDYGSFEGDEQGVVVSWPEMAARLKPGDLVMVDDGLLCFRVTAVHVPDYVETRIENGGELSDTKGINLPGIPVDLPALTEKDQRDIEFGLRNGVDFVAASFVRRAEDVEEMRAFMRQKLLEIRAQSGSGETAGMAPPADTPSTALALPLIISKIENQQGLDNFADILEASDGIMVARGDLGVEIPVEQVFRYQKWMITRCNRAGKPVITATQMLESMVTNPRPTRAEATDVANAVLDGSDSVMLSGETAKGAYPVRAVEIMARICRVAEADVNYGGLYEAMRKHARLPMTTHEAIASAAVRTSWEVQATCIIALTESGRMGRAFARYRPIPPVLAITASPAAARQMAVLRGIYPVVTHTMRGTEEIISQAMRIALMDGMATPGDPIVITSGVIEAHSGSTNLMRVLRCPTLDSIEAIPDFFL